MQNFRSMKRHRSTFAFRVLVDDVAPALARNGKAQFFQHGTNLASG